MKVKNTRKTAKRSVSIRLKQPRKYGIEKYLAARKRSNSPVNQQKIEKTFDDLNDDCIEEFLRRLPTAEAAKMSLVNKRINTIAVNLFKRTATENTFKIALIRDRATLAYNMRAFGKYIKNLHIFGSAMLGEDHFDRLRLINQFCGKSLNHLTLLGFHIDAKTVKNLKNLLPNIQTITFDTCSTSEEDSIFDLMLKYCKNLRHLDVEKCGFKAESWLQRSYNRLESMYFYTTGANTIHEQLPAFLQKNRRIQNLVLETNVKTLPINLGRDAPNIENLTIGMRKKANAEDFQSMFDLPRLKKLNIFYGFTVNPVVCTAVLKQLGACNTLDSFGLFEVSIPKEMCQLIANMTRLKELKIWGLKSIDNDTVTILSATLVNLELLSLRGKSFTFAVICEFIEKMPALKSLYLYRVGLDSDAADKQVAELIEVRRNVNEDLYTPLTIYVPATPSHRTFISSFQRKFRHNKYINVVAVECKVFASHYTGI